MFQKINTYDVPRDRTASESTIFFQNANAKMVQVINRRYILRVQLTIQLQLDFSKIIVPGLTLPIKC